MKVGEFLANRLKQLGCDQTFGVPGDYVLGLCDQLIEAGVEWVGCSNELNAGYAADGYARVSGIGCATVTYGVGGLSLINACAGAFAESVPLVVICGGPNLEAYNAESVVKTHHSIPGDMCAQLKAYQGVTAAAPLINDPGSAAKVIDRTLKTCLRHCRPVYLEIPLNIAAAECEDAQERLDKAPTSSWELGQVHDEEQCATAVEAAAKLIFGARRPAILAGVEICRVDAQPALRRLARMLRVPIATTRHGKTAIEEGGTLSAGVYQGQLSRAVVKDYVEGADVLIKVGSLHTDFDYLTAECGEGQAVVSTSLGGVAITQHSQAEENAAKYAPVAIVQFVDALSKSLWAHLGDEAFFTEAGAADAATKLSQSAADATAQGEPSKAKAFPDEAAESASGEKEGSEAFQPAALEASNAWSSARAAAMASIEHLRAFDAAQQPTAEDKLTANGFLHAVGRWLHNQPLPVTVLADTGDALVAAADMPLRPIDAFISQAFYSSIGYTVPAAVGAAIAHRNAFANNPPRHHTLPGDDERRRFVALVGDGAFQMTAQEVATSIRHKLPVTYVVLNNDGDSIERAVHEGPPKNNYNDIPMWRYSELLHAFGQAEGEGFAAAADTAGDLAAALESCNDIKYRLSTNLIEVRVGRQDRSNALVQFGNFLKSVAGLS